MQSSILFVVATLSPGILGGYAAGQTKSADPLDLDGIAHVAFRVSSVSESRAFYQKLGFEQAFEFSDATGTTTSYMKVNDRQFIELYRRDSQAQPLGLMHICFDSSTIERLRDAYFQRGLQPVAVVKARAGNLLFSMHDPEGQVLEYTQYLPGSLHWNARGKFQSDRRISTHMLSAAAPVKDLTAERAYYVDKLGFEDRGSTVTARLRVPGASGEEVELESATPDGKPRIEFAVDDLSRTTAELRDRGLTVRLSGAAALVTDPDGAAVVFTSQEAETARDVLTLEYRSMVAWQKGDPDPLLAILDPEITYFHTVAKHRLDGLPEVRALFESYRGTALFDSFEILNPRVQISGNIAVLTYLFVRQKGTDTSRWNATQVYRRNPDGWRILHTHWSPQPLARAAPSPPED